MKLSKWDFALMEKTQVHPGYYQIVSTKLFSSKGEAWGMIEEIVKRYNDE